jgi:hypothetical protein
MLDVQQRETGPATTSRPTPKNNLLPLGLLILGLASTLAWNGLIIFTIGRLIRLW